MRHLILLSTVFMGLVIFTSCEKEALQGTPQTPQNNSNVQVATRHVDKGNSSWGVHRHFFDNKPGEEGVEGEDYGCETPAESCADDTNITPKQTEVKKALQHIIDNHNQRDAVSENDILILQEYKDALSGVIFAAEDIDKLINGVYHLRIRSSKARISYTENNYYIFEEGTQIKRVYPIQLAK